MCCLAGASSWREGQALQSQHWLGQEEAGHSFGDDDPVVFKVELDASLLKGVPVDPKNSGPLFRC